jgi:predicted RNA-binding Zn-ribbon protein involved in translation (DUF1610 family)
MAKSSNNSEKEMDEKFKEMTEIIEAKSFYCPNCGKNLISKFCPECEKNKLKGKK